MHHTLTYNLLCLYRFNQNQEFKVRPFVYSELAGKDNFIDYIEDLSGPDAD